MSEEIKHILAKIDWIRILKESIELRPTSWGERPVVEWRNASDCLYVAVVRALEREGVLKRGG